MDCIVHGVEKSGTQLSHFHFQDKDEKSQTGQGFTTILQQKIWRKKKGTVKLSLHESSNSFSIQR